MKYYHLVILVLQFTILIYPSGTFVVIGMGHAPVSLVLSDLALNAPYHCVDSLVESVKSFYLCTVRTV